MLAAEAVYQYRAVGDIPDSGVPSMIAMGATKSSTIVVHIDSRGGSTASPTLSPKRDRT